jgi:hypothetical protein
MIEETDSSEEFIHSSTRKPCSASKRSNRSFRGVGSARNFCESAKIDVFRCKKRKKDPRSGDYRPMD